MKIRRAATALSTLVVAIVVALTMPTSQLRTVAVIHSCCCPDPSDCHCPPEHKGDPGTTPSMRTCHRTTQVIVAPGAPAALVADVDVVTPAPRVSAAPTFVPSHLHPSPDPRRPSAPS